MNNIPKGYKLVPVEPTAEILAELAADVYPDDNIAGKALQRLRGCDVVFPKYEVEGAVGKYQRMLAAAPTLPQPIYDEAKERELFERQTNIVDGIFYSVDHKCYRPINGRAVEHSDALDETLRLQGWLACAQFRAKAGEVLDE